MTAEDPRSSAEGIDDTPGSGGDRLADLFIPVPQGALVERLAALQETDAAAGRVREILRLLGLLLRIEGRETLNGLRDDYYPLNPDLPPKVGGAPGQKDPGAAHAALMARLERVLIQANFRPISQARLLAAERESAEVDVRIRIPREHYAEVAFYARGRSRARAVRRRFWGLVVRDREAIRLSHVVVVIRFRDHDHGAPPRWPLFRSFWRGGWSRPVRTAVQAVLGPGPMVRRYAGKTVIKLFTDVAEADLNTLYPGARAVMRLWDKLVLGVPAVVGGVPVLLNILPAVSVLAAVLAVWLGFAAAGSVDEAALAKALAAMSALAGLGAFLMRQVLKVERQVLKYQMTLTETLYYRSLCNNAAVFDTLTGTAEDQEFKEAALAYGLLEHTAHALDEGGLKAAVEAWLLKTFGVAVAFDVQDALDKLARLGLVTVKPDGTAREAPLAEALDRLRDLWHAEARDGVRVLAALGPPGGEG